MKEKLIPEKLLFEKRRRKPGRPPKNKKPIGRPKKFANPIEIHLMFEKRTINYINALNSKLKAKDVVTTRSDSKRVCVSKMIKS